jgi:DNA-binding Lrp family transcriptional regulator
MIATGKVPDDKDKQIIKLLLKRVSYKEITAIVCLSIPGIKKRIKIMKDHYGLDTTPQLLDYMEENGIL